MSNYEGNRWFLVLRVTDASSEGLTKLLRASNEVAQSFGQPGLYSDWQGSRTRHEVTRGSGDGTSALNAFKPRQTGDNPFHVSIGWTLSKPPEEDLYEQGMAMLSLRVEEVKVKIGNDVTSLKLSSEKVVAKHGLF